MEKLNEVMIVREIGFFDEETYQQIKKEMNKNNDYFSVVEFIELRQNYDKYKK